MLSDLEAETKNRAKTETSEHYKRFIIQSSHDVPWRFPRSQCIFQWLNAFYNFLLPPANAVIDLHPYHAFPFDTDTSSIISNICTTRAYAQSFHLCQCFSVNGLWRLAFRTETSGWGKWWTLKFPFLKLVELEEHSGH